jgi:DNA-binding NarL/FixJ family response regulator
MTRVLVVDDHPLFREGLVGLLRTVAGIDAVESAGDGERAVELCTRLRPDIVFMDLNLPGISGVEATRRITLVSPVSAVLIMTMVDDDATVVEALKAGARGYLLKGADQEEVRSALQTVIAGGAVFGAGVAAQVLALARGTVAVRPSEDGLTTREREVLDRVAGGQTNGQIARDLGVSVKTVQNHVSRVLTKIQATDRTQAALRARGLGQRGGS